MSKKQSNENDVRMVTEEELGELERTVSEAERDWGSGRWTEAMRIAYPRLAATIRQLRQQLTDEQAKRESADKQLSTLADYLMKRDFQSRFSMDPEAAMIHELERAEATISILKNQVLLEADGRRRAEAERDGANEQWAIVCKDREQMRDYYGSDKVESDLAAQTKRIGELERENGVMREALVSAKQALDAMGWYRHSNHDQNDKRVPVLRKDIRRCDHALRLVDKSLSHPQPAASDRTEVKP